MAIMGSRVRLPVALACFQVAMASAVHANDEASLVQKQLSVEESAGRRSMDVPELPFPMPKAFTDPVELTEIFRLFAHNFRNRTTAKTLTNYIPATARIWSKFTANLTGLAQNLSAQHKVIKSKDEALDTIRDFFSQRREAQAELVSNITVELMKIRDALSTPLRPWANILVSWMIDSCTLSGFDDAGSLGKRVKRGGHLQKGTTYKMAKDNMMDKEDELTHDPEYFCVRIRDMWPNVTAVGAKAQTMVPVLETMKTTMQFVLKPLVDTVAPDVSDKITEFTKEAVETSTEIMAKLAPPIHDIIDQLTATIEKHMDCQLPAPSGSKK